MLPRNASATFRVVSTVTFGLPSRSPPGQKPIVMIGLLSGTASRKLVFKKDNDSACCRVKNIFQVPDQAHCFIIWCWFLFFEERRFTQLLQVHIDLAGIVFCQCFRQIIDNSQHRIRDKIGWGGQLVPAGWQNLLAFLPVVPVCLFCITSDSRCFSVPTPLISFTSLKAASSSASNNTTCRSTY